MKKQKKKYTKEILEELKKADSIQGKECRDNCRYAIVSMMVVSWGLLMNESDNVNKWILVVILLLGIVYFVIAVLSSFSIAKLARDLHIMRCDNLITDDGVKIMINRRTDKVFGLLKYLIFHCLIMTVILGVYVFKNLL